MTYTVQVSELHANATPRTRCHVPVSSLVAAIRVADSHAPAPLSPAVRARMRRDFGGEARVGAVLVSIGCEG